MDFHLPNRDIVQRKNRIWIILLMPTQQSKGYLLTVQKRLTHFHILDVSHLTQRLDPCMRKPETAS